MRNIKRNINIRSEQIGGQFNELFQLINEIESCGSEEISLDFSATSFVTPFFLLPLFVHIRNHPKTIIIKNLPEYLHTVHFDEEIYPERLPQGLASFLEDYRLKTYIPILSFPNEAKQIGFKNEILHAAEILIMQRLNIPVNVRGGIKYLISEAVDNISEHSESERGYIFMQYYSYLGYLDICIADRGITVLGSYKKMPGNSISSDAEAIQAASQGISTKNLPDAENRGYGIGTSKRMLVDGLGGQYFMLSGNGFHLKNKSREDYVTLPPKIRWQGTIIALRIPYNSNKKFQITNYLE